MFKQLNQILLAILIPGLLNNIACAEPVVFEDINLKAAIEEALGVKDPTSEQMKELRSISISNRNITSLVGLEHLGPVTSFFASDNQISDLSPLSSLKFIVIDTTSGQPNRILDLANNNISDLSPLSKTSASLILDNNQIEDLSPLDGRGYQLLSLSNNQISDLSPLSRLVVGRLNLNNNQISNLTPLADIKAMILRGGGNHPSPINVAAKLDLRNNQIRNLKGLTENKHIQSLNLKENPLSCDAFQNQINVIHNNNPPRILPNAVAPQSAWSTVETQIITDLIPSDCEISTENQITIDFESTILDDHASISESGYSFTPIYAAATILQDHSQALSGIWGDMLVLRKDDGDAFDLMRFYLKGRWPGVSGNLIVRGLFTDGSTQEKTIAYSQDDIPLADIPITPWTSVELGWQSLYEVTLFTPDGRALLDNFLLSGEEDKGNSNGTTQHTLQFEDTQPDHYSTVEESGYQFTSSSGALDVLQDSSHVLSGLWGNITFLRRNDGGAFDLTRFKAKGRWPTISSQIIVRGTFTDGSTQEQSISYSQPDIPLAEIPDTPWIRVELNWENLTEVSFFTPNGRVLMDDFEVKQ